MALGLIMIWGSKVGKRLLRDKMIDSISWRGDEKVLDVGCGHGLMLIGAAKRLAGEKKPLEKSIGFSGPVASWCSRISDTLLSTQKSYEALDGTK